MSVLIETKGLVKTYRKGKDIVRAADDVSFAIERGTTMGLVGESGSGKSTTGRCILRLTEPDAGEVLFAGTPVTSRNIKEYRRKMQIIFQSPSGSLDPFLRTEEIITEGMKSFHIYDNAAQERDAAAELLYKVGLKKDDLYRYPAEFSGGQQQRIGIARALAVSPEFIVCDEPVSALDVSYQSQIINMLTELQASEKMTYLFISHDLSVVGHISDTIGVMYKGRLVETGTCTEIFSHHVHPYTDMLFSAIPVPDPVRAAARVRTVSDADDGIPQGGCPFRNRCPRASEICRSERPELAEIGPGHMCACHMI